MSKYDNIETVAELVAEVRANGLSEEIDDLASIQEIFDSTPTDELIRIICDIGQDTEHMAFEEVKAENARLRLSWRTRWKRSSMSRRCRPGRWRSSAPMNAR